MAAPFPGPQRIVHTNLSGQLSANALLPPWNHNQVHMYSLVKISPQPSGISTIHPLRENLTKYVSWEQALQLQQITRTFVHTQSRYLQFRKRKSGRCAVSAKAFSQALGLRGAKNDVLAQHFKVFDLKSTSLKDGHVKLLEHMIVQHFPKLVVHSNMSDSIRERFLIGIVTGTVTGRLELNTADAADFGLGADATLGMPNLGTAANANKDSTHQHIMQSVGVLGLNLICFLVETHAQQLKYDVSKAILAERGDELEFEMSCKYLYQKRTMSDKWRAFTGSYNYGYLLAGSHTVDGRGLRAEDYEVFKKITTSRGTIPSSWTVPGAHGVQRSNFFIQCNDPFSLLRSPAARMDLNSLASPVGWSWRLMEASIRVAEVDRDAKA